MALIKCPECGKEISDKSEKCVNCGCPIVPEEETNITIPAKKTHKHAKNIILFITILLIISGSIYYFFIYSNKKTNEEYLSNLRELQSFSFLGAVQAEKLCNNTYDVWNNYINSKKSSSTDKYTLGKYGVFVSSVEDAISNLYKDKPAEQAINIMNHNTAEVNKIIAKIQNPPDEYRDYYEIACNLYDNYIKYTNLALSPSGNIIEYKKNIDQLSAEYLTQYNKLDRFIPVKTESE